MLQAWLQACVRTGRLQPAHVVHALAERGAEHGTVAFWKGAQAVGNAHVTGLHTGERQQPLVRPSGHVLQARLGLSLDGLKLISWTCQAQRQAEICCYIHTPTSAQCRSLQLAQTQQPDRHAARLLGGICIDF